MKYATWWTRVWLLVSTLAVGLGILEWSAPVAVVAILVVSAVAALVTITLRNELFTLLPGTRPSRSGLLGLSFALGAGVVGGFAVLAASPALGMLLVGLAAGTSPPVLARVLPGHNVSRAVPRSARPASAGPREPHGSGGQLAAQQSPGPPTQRVVATMNIEELCALWRHTFWQLHDEDEPDRRASLVSLRQTCLEELEKRNPSGFAAWLDAGGRASGAPERFMLRRPTDGGSDGVV